VNPRFGGASALGRAAGVDTPLLLIRLLKGEDLSREDKPFNADLVMLRFSDDIFLDKSELLSPTQISSGLATARMSTTSEPRSDLRAVILDLDNTLYPEEQFVTGGFRAVAAFFAPHLDVTPDELLARMMDLLRAHGRGQVFNLLLAERNMDSAAWLPTLLHVYRSHQPALSLFPETASLLRDLKSRGLKLGLVTDGLASVQRRKISALALEPFMDAVVCTGELGHGQAKPSPIPFQVALNLLNVPAEQAVYVADDISKDFAGPNQLGMKSVQISSKGLLGVRQNPLPDNPLHQPQMTAESLRQAFTLLGLM
jgi:putative hydrolase of the HAD superfamily